LDIRFFRSNLNLIITNFLDFGLRFGISFLIPIFLGASLYGDYSYIIKVVTFFQILNLGALSGYSKFIAENKYNQLSKNFVLNLFLATSFFIIVGFLLSVVFLEIETKYLFITLTGLIFINLQSIEWTFYKSKDYRFMFLSRKIIINIYLLLLMVFFYKTTLSETILFLIIVVPTLISIRFLIKNANFNFKIHQFIKFLKKSIYKGKAIYFDSLIFAFLTSFDFIIAKKWMNELDFPSYSLGIAITSILILVQIQVINNFQKDVYTNNKKIINTIIKFSFLLYIGFIIAFFVFFYFEINLIIFQEYTFDFDLLIKCLVRGLCVAIFQLVGLFVANIEKLTIQYYILLLSIPLLFFITYLNNFLSIEILYILSLLIYSIAVFKQYNYEKL
jgi:O-antigen/teichoic acid export membrane protein